MAESCAVDAPISRKSQTLILQRLAAVGQSHVGQAIGKSESWVSRWKSEDSETCADLLSALGLKVVPAQYKCYDQAHIEHLHYFARIGLAQQPTPTLEWGEDA